jgi:hypothetical protein
MALQDLTPQLRTRLSRLERVVGLFVAVATLLLVVGLIYYIYQTAVRKGWFLPKLPYFTFVRSAAGLKVGQPVKLMGLDVGVITLIDPQPPGSYYDMYVAFRVKKPYYGYLWEDSVAKVGASDFLGNRFIELTKGTNGPATYLFRQFREVSLSDAELFLGTNEVFLVDEVYDETKTNVLAKPMDLLTREVLNKIIEAASVTTIRLIDTPGVTKHPTGIWDFQEGRYKSPLADAQTKKGYFLVPAESPALGDRLENVANIVESALPGILNLTNQISRTLESAARSAARAEELLTDARPIMSNLTLITRNITDPRGSLGEWILPTELNAQLTETFTSANSLLTNSDARLTGVATGLDLTLINMAGITSNLHAQVQANTNLIRELSTVIVHADDLLQGLKRHWLLRSAFKTDKPSDRVPAKPGPRKARSPKDAAERN